jgi:DNA processing protein
MRAFCWPEDQCERERLEWIALAWHARLGPGAFYRLVERFGLPRDVCAAGREALEASRVRLTERQTTAIGEACGFAGDILEEIESLEDEGVQVLCAFEEGYPAPLKDLRTAPPVVTVAGEWRAEQDMPAVALVGTRSPTEEGLALAHDLAVALAEEGLTVVSGLARGIDTAAHQGALEGGGRTVAILGSGLRVLHPPENRELAAQTARRGALLSELPPRARPSVRSLMARNRLQSALSNAVVVVESGDPGGALQTAQDARRQGRVVYAVAWSRDRPQVQGNRRLLAQGALPVQGVADVPEIAARLRAPQPVARPPSRPRQLSLF